VFQTEPILWLQAHGSPPVTALLSIVTLLGYMPVYAGLLIVLAFAVRLRASLAVLGGVLLAGLLVEGFKDGVGYPRPDQVDARVARTFATAPIEPYPRGGATSFWSRPQPEAIEAVRRRIGGDYGFPSGHVAAATAFLLCVAWFFRSGRVLAVATAWVPLMALSRMYLGRHFLADVLGGLSIGLAAAALAFLLFRSLDDGLSRRRDLRAQRALVPTALLSLGLLVLTPYEPLLRPEYAGGLAGLGACYAYLLVTGLPADGGTGRQRARRVAVGGLVLLGGLAAMAALQHLVGRQGARLALLWASLLVTAGTFAGTAAICRRLGLYPRQPEVRSSSARNAGQQDSRT
jgi:membrane-associated phospholipid phosphatase